LPIGISHFGLLLALKNSAAVISNLKPKNPIKSDAVSAKSGGHMLRQTGMQIISPKVLKYGFLCHILQIPAEWFGNQTPFGYIVE
jgi:hypothetical protein